MSRINSLKNMVFASAGVTSIPPTPQVGVTYRDATLDEAKAADGWPYYRVVNGAEFNQMMFLLSSVVNEVEKTGLLQWSQLTDYPVGGITRGSNGLFYEALLVSGPNEGGYKDPIDVANASYWKEILKQTEGDAIPVGSLVTYCGAEADIPERYLVCDGAVLSKTDYPELFAVINYNYGGGGENFNLPTMTDGRYVRFVSGVGLSAPLAEQLPNIKGRIDEIATMNDATATGAFIFSNYFDTPVDGSIDRLARQILDFNAASSNSVYTDGGLVTPKSLNLLPLIKYI